MKKYAALVFLSLGFTSVFANNLPECTNQQVNNAITAIRTDAALLRSVEHFISSIRQYPEVKNCTAFNADLCAIDSRVSYYLDRMHCIPTKAQDEQIYEVLAPLFSQLTEEEMRKGDEYWDECIPSDGSDYPVCSTSTAQARATAKRSISLRNIFKTTADK